VGKALTQALAAGDPAAFAALYDRLGARLYATAHTLTGSAAEAEDIVQDLFVELATHRHRLNEVQVGSCFRAAAGSARRPSAGARFQRSRCVCGRASSRPRHCD